MKRGQVQYPAAWLVRWENGHKPSVQPRRRHASGMPCVTRASSGPVAHASTVNLDPIPRSLVVPQHVRPALPGRGPERKLQRALLVRTASIQQLPVQLRHRHVVGAMWASGRLSAAALVISVTYPRRH